MEGKNAKQKKNTFAKRTTQFQNNKEILVIIHPLFPEFLPWGSQTLGLLGERDANCAPLKQTLAVYS